MLNKNNLSTKTESATAGGAKLTFPTGLLLPPRLCEATVEQRINYNFSHMGSKFVYPKKQNKQVSRLKTV